MVRRVVEEDVVTPSTTVVEDDGSWIGRTIVTLVILALLVAGAVWLVRTLSDSDIGDGRQTENNNTNNTENNTENNNTNPDGSTGDTGGTQPTAVPS